MKAHKFSKTFLKYNLLVGSMYLSYKSFLTNDGSTSYLNALVRGLRVGYSGLRIVLKYYTVRN